MTDRDPLYRRHRFPADVIAHAMWLYLRFPLRLRMVEDFLAVRAIIVSHQTARLWPEKFGGPSPTISVIAHPVGLGTSGTSKHWLWRIVDQDGFVLEALVQSRRNAKAAKRLMRKLSEGQGRSSQVMITDKLDPTAQQSERSCRVSSIAPIKS